MDDAPLPREARLVAANHVLANTPRDDYSNGSKRLSEAFTAAPAAFHVSLIDAGGSPILRDICRSLYDASEFYRRWTYSVPGAVRDIPGEHRALMEAALARDTERAVALLTEHFERTTRSVLASLPSVAPTPAARKLVPLGTAARRRGSPAS